MPDKRRRLAGTNDANQGIWFIRIFAIFWNGFIAMFIYVMITQFHKSGGNWFMILFMVPFVLVGIFLACAAFNPKLLQQNAGTNSGLPELPDKNKINKSELQLKPQTTPGKSLLGSIFISVFWNGIVSVFLWHVVKEWTQGKQEWFLILFLSPFVLIGVVLIYSVIYAFLQLFNPKSVLTLSNSMVKPGESVTLKWKFAGSAERMDSLKITLEGREEATYSRGTSTYTDKEVFATISLLETRSKSQIRQGSAQIKIPPDAMPSFASSHNRIIWTIKVQGEIPKWPDVNDEYPITIYNLERSDLKMIEFKPETEDDDDDD